MRVNVSIQIANVKYDTIVIIFTLGCIVRRDFNANPTF